MMRILTCVLAGAVGLAGCGGGGPHPETAPETDLPASDAGEDVDGGVDAGADTETDAGDLVTVTMRLVESMTEEARETREAVRVWIRVLVRVGLRERASARLEQMTAPSEVAASDAEWVARRYMELGMFDEAKILSERIDRFDQQGVLAHGARYFASVKDCESIARLLDVFPEGFSTSFAREELAECLARQGEHQRAMAVVEACGGCRDSGFTGWDGACSGCQVQTVLALQVRDLANRGELAAALELIDANLARLRQEHSAYYHYSNWESTFKRRDNTPRWTKKELRQAIETATANNLTNLLLVVLVAGLDLGKQEQALAIIERVDDRSSRDRLKVKAAAGLARAGDLERALEVARSAEAKLARARALVEVAKAPKTRVAREKYLDILREAVGLIRKGKRAWERDIVLGQIVTELIGSGDLDGAWKTFRAIKDSDSRCDIAVEMALGLVRGRQFERAEKLLGKCRVKEHELAQYLMTYVELGEHIRAIDLFNRLVEGASRRTGLRAASGMGRVCSEIETCRPVAAVLDRIVSKDRRELARISATAGQIKAGRFDEALDSLDTLSSRSRGIVVRDLIVELVQRDQQGRAIEIARSQPEADSEAAYEALADGFAAVGDDPRALEWADKTGYSRDHTFWLRLAQGLLDAGEYELAWNRVAFVQGRPSEEWNGASTQSRREDDLISAAESYVSGRQFERALFLLAHVQDPRKKLRVVRRMGLDIVDDRYRMPEVTEPELLRLVAKKLGE